MIVTCPGCSAKYRVRNEAVPQDGARMRCPKCETLFLAKPPSASDDDDDAQMAATPGARQTSSPSLLPQPSSSLGAPQRGASNVFASQQSFTGAAPFAQASSSPGPGAFGGANPFSNPVPFPSGSYTSPPQFPAPASPAGGPFAGSPFAAPPTTSPFAPPPLTTSPFAPQASNPFAAPSSVFSPPSNSFAPQSSFSQQPTFTNPTFGSVPSASGITPRPGTSGMPGMPGLPRTQTPYGSPDPFAGTSSPGLYVDAEPRPPRPHNPALTAPTDLMNAPRASAPISRRPRARTGPVNAPSSSVAQQLASWVVLLLALAVSVTGVTVAVWTSESLDLDNVLMARAEQLLGVRPPRSFAGHDNDPMDVLVVAARKKTSSGDVADALLAWRRVLAVESDNSTALAEVARLQKQLGER